MNYYLLDTFNWIANLVFFSSLPLLLLSIRYKSIKVKRILIIVLLFLIPYTWINVVQPIWKAKIRNKIYAANYCEIDSDCVTIESYTFFCDKYNINRKELDNIKKNMDLYKLFALFDNDDLCDVIISLEPKCNKDTKRCKQAEDPTEPKNNNKGPWGGVDVH